MYDSLSRKSLKLYNKLEKISLPVATLEVLSLLLQFPTQLVLKFWKGVSNFQSPILNIYPAILYTYPAILNI